MQREEVSLPTNAHSGGSQLGKRCAPLQRRAIAYQRVVTDYHVGAGNKGSQSHIKSINIINDFRNNKRDLSSVPLSHSEPVVQVKSIGLSAQKMRAANLEKSMRRMKSNQVGLRSKH